MKSLNLAEIQYEKVPISTVRKKRKNRKSKETERFPELHPRDDGDPMRLYHRVLDKLDHYFLTRSSTYLSGQRELLAKAVEAVLLAVMGVVTAIPFQPGLGKSTLIRALLSVFSEEFRYDTPIAQRVGGVIVVVEKTAEAEELEKLCNEHAKDRLIARAISSPNDYNLSLGKCLNGSASSYEECPGRSCADYSDCPLIQSAYQNLRYADPDLAACPLPKVHGGYEALYELDKSRRAGAYPNAFAGGRATAPD